MPRSMAALPSASTPCPTIIALRISGTPKITSKIGDYTSAAVSRSESDTDCNMQLERSGGIFGALWNFDTAGAMAKPNSAGFVDLTA